jgi:lysine N6-hydroxylase
MYPHYRCVGIGVGPANLSLAALLHDRPDVPNLFLERKRTFGWHDGQLIRGATLQVSLFKDLVTLADPTNRFSFLSYLHDQGRIYHFINAQFNAMPRLEFRNYLKWASLRNKNIVFGDEVLSVAFDGRFVLNTSRRTVTADHISIGVGSRPLVPASARKYLGDTQFHVSEFVTKAHGLHGRRVAVIGGGQSGAEAVLDLVSRPDGERPRRIWWISRRHNFFPIDDSPFTNDYFMPSFSDYFARLDPEVRKAFNAGNVLASDGISMNTLRELYQQIYLHRFVYGNRDLIGLHPGRTVTEVTEDHLGSGCAITIEATLPPHSFEQVKADVVIWATGFRPAPLDFLDPIAGRLEREGDELKIDQHFAVRWDGAPEHNIFLHNAARAQRGLADPNLSLIAWRSQRIIDRIVGATSGEQLDSFVEWAATETTDGFL